jgi:hypothetical protein
VSARPYEINALNLPPVIVATLALGLSACDGDPVLPAPQPVELRITGATEFYVGGTASIDSTTVELRNGIVDLRGTFPGRETRAGTMILELLKDDPVAQGGQTTRAFDRYTADVVLTPGIVRIDLELLDTPLAMLELSRPAVSALLVDDPCVLDTRFESSAESVDADRALYQGTFQNLIEFVFASTDSYGGGNIFEDGQDRAHFAATCASDAWDLADTTACVELGRELVCLFHAWERADG